VLLSSIINNIESKEVMKNQQIKPIQIDYNNPESPGGAFEDTDRVFY